MMLGLESMHAIYGLVRTRALRRIGGPQQTWAPCVPLLTGIVLEGGIAHAGAPLSASGEHGGARLQRRVEGAGDARDARHGPVAPA